MNEVKPGPAAPVRVDDPWHRPWSVRGAMRAAAGIALVGTGILALWWARNVALLIVAGVLLGVVLHASSRRLSQVAYLPRLAALGVIVVALAAGLTAVVWLSGPMLAEQAGQLVQNLIMAALILTQRITGASAEELAGRLAWEDFVEFMPSPWGIATGATAVASGALGAIAAIAIVLFVGIYLAAHPQTYTRLAVRLAPEARRDQVREMLDEAGTVVRWWLKGQLLAMLLIGLATYAGLVLIGMPFALALAIFAGLTNFIPYIGPVISDIAILLVASGEGTLMVLWAVGLYVVIQSLESAVLVPMIQSRAVWLPPAIVIVNQLLFGALFGILGVMLATPIAAAATVPLRRLFPELPSASGEAPLAGEGRGG